MRFDKSTRLGKIEAFKDMDDKSWVLIYAHDRIAIEKKTTISEIWLTNPLEKLKELRVFNPNKELHIWRYGNFFASRLFNESDIERLEYEVYREEKVLWGNTITDNKLIEEGRGMQIVFPCNLSSFELPIKVVTESFYTFDDNGMIVFQDARLVDFVDASGQSLMEQKGGIHG